MGSFIYFLPISRNKMCEAPAEQKAKAYWDDWCIFLHEYEYESIATVGKSQVWWRADFQSGSRVLKKVF